MQGRRCQILLCTGRCGATNGVAQTGAALAFALGGDATRGWAMISAVLSVMVLVAVLLLLGAVAAWRRGQHKQAVLMVVLALIMAGNVAIWTLPDEKGNALAQQGQR